MDVYLSSDIKTGLRFFNDTITTINTKRLKTRQSLGFADFVVNQLDWNNRLFQWSSPLGILSFVLYYARFILNVILLLLNLATESSEEVMDNDDVVNVSLNLLNDGIWGTINLAQYFWLTLKRSMNLGFCGVLLEGVGMLFDEVVMLFQYRQHVVQHRNHLGMTTSLEQQARLDLEWRYKAFNMIRVSLHITILALLFIGIGLGFTMPFPISIFVYSLNVISHSIRIGLGLKKDIERLNLMRREQDMTEEVVVQFDRKAQYEALRQANHFIHFLVFVPLGLILSAPCSMTISVGMILTVFLSDYLGDYALEQRVRPIT